MRCLCSCEGDLGLETPVLRVVVRGTLSQEMDSLAVLYLNTSHNK
jgi:hypothetical protein